jgi:predicted DNA-binding transcriptional regulator AlpA
MTLTANEFPAESHRRSEHAPHPPKARRVKDACSTLGISRATLYKLSLQGKVKLVKIAGRTVVPETEIEARVGRRRLIDGPLRSGEGRHRTHGERPPEIRAHGQAA